MEKNYGTCCILISIIAREKWIRPRVKKITQIRHYRPKSGTIVSEIFFRAWAKKNREISDKNQDGHFCCRPKHGRSPEFCLCWGPDAQFLSSLLALAPFLAASTRSSGFNDQFVVLVVHGIFAFAFWE
jgi:hypothetical protein